MREKRALLIEWNPSSGKRAGNINPRDINLRCNGWQNMDVTPALELRLVEDDRDLSKYKGVGGVKVLYGTDQINEAIDANFPSKVVIDDELFYSEHVKLEISQKRINVSKLPHDKNERLKKLKDEYGIQGLKEIKPQKV